MFSLPPTLPLQSSSQKGSHRHLPTPSKHLRLGPLQVKTTLLKQLSQKSLHLSQDYLGGPTTYPSSIPNSPTPPPSLTLPYNSLTMGCIPTQNKPSAAGSPSVSPDADHHSPTQTSVTWSELQRKPDVATKVLNGSRSRISIESMLLTVFPAWLPHP